MFPVKRVAVIGGGPCGLALAKTLLAEKKFESVQVFERQSKTGGVWNYYPGTRETPLIPSTDPYKKEPHFIKNGKPVYFNPMYRELETNIPKDVMMYNNTWFDKDLDTFPKREDVLKYVQAYGEPVKDAIKLNTEVTSVEKTGTEWKVSYTSDNETKSTQSFDAVVICTGHYDLPHIPDVKGIKTWAEKFPGTISHSKYYNDPNDFEGQTVLVVGNSASGLDVSMQVASYAKKVYRSISTASKMPYADDPRITDVPVIEEYDSSRHEIKLTDGSILTNIDKIIYCTGYLYSFPFLKSYMDRTVPDSLITTGNRLNRLYRQIFYIPDPTLAVIVMTKFTVPFPLAETQGSVVARVFAGRLGLPTQSAMRESEKEEEEAKGDGSAFHNLSFPADVEYIRDVQAWMNKDTTPSKDPSVGFQPEVWDDAKYAKREGAYALKKQRLEEKVSSLSKV